MKNRKNRLWKIYCGKNGRGIPSLNPLINFELFSPVSGIIVLKWEKIGDMKNLEGDYISQKRKHYVNLFRDNYGKTEFGDKLSDRFVVTQFNQLWNFTFMQLGDLIFAPCVKNKVSYILIGRVSGDYLYDKSQMYPHTRTVVWEKLIKESRINPEFKELRTIIANKPTALVRLKPSLSKWNRLKKLNVLPQNVSFYRK